MNYSTLNISHLQSMIDPCLVLFTIVGVLEDLKDDGQPPQQLFLHFKALPTMIQILIDSYQSPYVLGDKDGTIDMVGKSLSNEGGSVLLLLIRDAFIVMTQIQGT